MSDLGEKRRKKVEVMSSTIIEKITRQRTLMPKRPSARLPLARMRKSPEMIGAKSPRRTRTRSKSPMEYDSTEESSESQSELTPESVRCHVPRQRSPIDSRSRNVSPAAKVAQPKTQSSDATKPKCLNVSYVNESSRPRSGKQTSQPGKNYFCLMCYVVVPIVLIIFGILQSNAKHISMKDNTKTGDEAISQTLRSLEKSIDDVREKFKQQEPTTWHNIEAGIAGVIRDRKKPAIFFFFSNQDDPMFCLAKMIGNVSKAALGSDENLFLSPKNLGSDYGAALVNLEDQIRQQKVVIVQDLLDVHPEAIKAFHNLCDRENPLVREAIYILTMVTSGYQFDDSAIEFVENQLTRSLKGKVDDEKLQPLITRMTDAAIIHVLPEPEMKSCPIRY